MEPLKIHDPFEPEGGDINARITALEEEAGWASKNENETRERLNLITRQTDMITEERVEHMQQELAIMCGDLRKVRKVLNDNRVRELEAKRAVQEILDYIDNKKELHLCKAIAFLSHSDETELDMNKQAWCRLGDNPNGREWHG